MPKNQFKMAQVRNMVFMTKMYVFINSAVKVEDKEIVQKIQNLPKTFIQGVQKLCKYVTEYGYDEHTHEAILVCRFENKDDFSEATRMDMISNKINAIHAAIAHAICNDFEKTIAEKSSDIEAFVKMEFIEKDEDEKTCDAH